MATTYKNADGTVMALGTVTGLHIVGSKAGQTLTGGAGNDAIRSYGGDTMVGGAGDDTYYVMSASDVVVEAANGGNDTIVSYITNNTLSANIENLQVAVTGFGYGIGNDLNNILIAGSGTITLDGGKGSDVLVAGTGTDTFVVQAGYGSKVIYGFKTATDLVQLKDQSSLTSFSALQSDMAQVGADVVITLPNAQKVILRSTTLSSLTAKNFLLPNTTGVAGTTTSGTTTSGTTTSGSTVSTGTTSSGTTTAGSTNAAAASNASSGSATVTPSSSQWVLTFDDEFNTLSASANGVGTTWRMDTGTRTSNHEAQDYVATLGAGSPFSVSNGVLNITATPGTNPLNLSYNSGELTTMGTFAQTYGLFEVRAQLPAGAGMWPAFWLLNAGGGWPPELDVMEMLGNNPSTIYNTVHTKETGTHTATSKGVYVGDTSADYHVYGVDWEADYITFYVDGNAVSQVATPSDMNSPMYMLLNLAVGDTGSWPGAAAGESGTMKVDWVRVYQSTANSAVNSTVSKWTTSSGTDQTVHTATSSNTAATSTTTGTTTTTKAATTSATVSNAATAAASSTYTANAAHTGYAVSTDASGNVTIQQSGQSAVSLGNVSQIAFSDGVGVIDTTGAAESVVRIYQAAFDRAPDLAGLQYWAAQINSGASTAAGVANAFAATSEFATRYAALSDGDYVSAIYQDVFGRAPDASGAQYWTGLLQAGSTRGDVLSGLAGSAENIQKTIGIAGDANESQIYRLYLAAFGAAPDASGLNYWTNVAQGGASAGQIANGFMQSPQFAAEYGAGSTDGDFVSALYQHVLGRAGDSSGTAYWGSALQNGITRGDVLVSFANSSENLLNTAAATHNGWVFVAS